MVTSGHSSHQLPRVAGGNSCSAVIHNAQMQNICATVNRQHRSCGLHKSLGEYSIQGFSELDKEPVDVVFREKYSYHSSTPPRNPECCRRCGILVTDRQDILEAEPFHFSQDSEDLRPSGSGSLCNSPVFPVPTLLQLAARSICRSNRCISPSLDPHQGVCQPSLESSRQDTHPVVNSTSYHCAGGSRVEGTTMVPCSPTHANGLPETNNNRNEDNGKQGQLPDAPTTSHMAHLRERYRGQQLLEEATDLVLSSWRAKTNKFYDAICQTALLVF